jgi:hypothetical protein
MGERLDIDNFLSPTGWAEATELGPGQTMARSRPRCDGEIQGSNEYLRLRQRLDHDSPELEAGPDPPGPKHLDL